MLAVLLAVGCARAGGVRPEAVGTTAPAAGGTDAPLFVYVAAGGGEIVLLHLRPDIGRLARRSRLMVGRSASSLAYSTERQVLVLTDEAAGAAISLAVNAKTGVLTRVGRAATGGGQPSGATVDGTGKYLMVANRGSGTAAVLSILPQGALDPVDTFKAGAGASAVGVHPSNGLVFVANLRGSSVSQYSFNVGTGMLTPKPGPPVALPADSGPSRFACHPGGRWVYILNESNDTISAHAVGNDTQALSPLASAVVSTLPSGFPGRKSRPSDLQLGRGGRFLYATNRGHDSVVTFAVDLSGELTLVGHQPSGGRAASALAIDPSGKYLLVANHDSKNLVLFRLDPTSGTPSAVQTVDVDAPPLAVCAVQPPR